MGFNAFGVNLLWQVWGGKREGINRMAERSTDDCIWIGLFPAQDYRFRGGISLWLLLLTATNVCIARLKYSRKIILSGFASTYSSVTGGEAARRQHHVKTSCGERPGGCRGWASVSSYWTSAVKPSSPLAKQKHHWSTALPAGWSSMPRSSQQEPELQI